MIVSVGGGDVIGSDGVISDIGDKYSEGGEVAWDGGGQWGDGEGQDWVSE